MTTSFAVGRDRALGSATVISVHEGYVDVKIGGSAQITRGLRVVGGTSCLHEGDTVLLKEADGVLYAQSFCTGEAAGGAPASTTLVQIAAAGSGGLCLNKIMLIHAGGSCVTEYDPDDTGFNDALTAATAGDLVWLPAGEIELSSQKTVPDGVTISGCGSESTTVKLEDSHDANLTMFSIGSNVVLEDMTIDANETNQASGWRYCVHADTKTNITIWRISFEDCTDEYVYSEESSEVLVQGCTFEIGYTTIGIYLENDTTVGRNFQILDNRFMAANATYSYAIFAYGGATLVADLDNRYLKNVIISGNTYENTDGKTDGSEGHFLYGEHIDGVVVEGNTAQYVFDFCYLEEVTMVSVVGNVVESAYGEGIWISDAWGASTEYDDGPWDQYIVVANNVLKQVDDTSIGIYGPTKSGIARNDADDEAGAHQVFVAIVGNSIYSGTTANAIILQDCAFATVSGNVMYGSSEGLWLDGGCWECVVSGNVFANSALWNMIIEGYDHLITGNYVARAGDHGLYLNAAERCHVVGNFVTESSQSADDTSSNIFLDYAEDCVIANNVIAQGGLTNQPKYGIEIDSDSQGNILMDNFFLGGGGKTQDIKDDSTDTVWGNTQSARVTRMTDYLVTTSGGEVSNPSSWEAVDWASEDHDWGDLWAAGSPSRFTFGLGGLIELDAHLAFEPNATGKRGIRFIVDGTTPIAQKLVDNRGGSKDTYLDLSTCEKIDPGSYVEVEVYQNSGGNLNVQGGGSYTPVFCASAIGQP
jgi:parallel beta-helix repeat protein